MNNSAYNDYCNNSATIDPILNDSIIANPNVLNLFIPDCMTGYGNAGYPLGNPPPGISQANWFFVKDEVVDMDYWAVTAHEIGHLLGLFHTFETGAFPAGCSNACDEGDGMEDVPFDAVPWTPGAPSPVNLMDYDEIAIDPLVDPFIEMTNCQKSKFLQLLFWCRNNLCAIPSQPDVQNTNNLSVNSLIYDRGDQMDILQAILNAANRTNTGNFAKFKLKNTSGAVLHNAFVQTLDLNAVFALPSVPDYGNFTLEVLDSSVYNSSCKSVPTIVSITIHPCNYDGICDPMENFGNCTDCHYSSGGPLPTITQLEYFIDTDPGFGMGTPITITPDSVLDVDVNINLTSLTTGVHVLYVRGKDSNNKWSFTQKKLFYKNSNSINTTGALTALEYFIDTDPGFGMGTPLSLANTTNSVASYSIPLTGLTPGVHVLYSRVKNDRGEWGFTQKKLFHFSGGTTGGGQIVQLEYYLDNDPGYGNGTQVSITPGSDLDINHTISTTGLDGNHRIYYRAKDNAGQWSFVVNDTLVWSDDTVKVLSPNGGQAYLTGGNITNISFYKSSGVGAVTLRLVRSNGSPVYTIATNVTTSPYPSWTIPLYANAGEYRIEAFSEGEPTVKDYSDNIITISNTATCAAFTDLFTAGEPLDAASCLCGLNYVIPQAYSYNNTYGVNPTANIYRADLAKLVYFAIYKGNPASPADPFPVPFVDLQQSGDPYYRYAKALSYLQYQDEVTPFDRDFVNFRPYDFIERRDALKVLLEAYNIPPDNTNGGTILGMTPADDGYGYVHKAFDLGLVTTGSGFHNMIRGDMFIVLYRLLNSCGTNCDPNCLNPAPEPADYFTPGNLTPFNLARSIGMAEGYFKPYSESSFNIPGFNLPLTFSHAYNSYLTELPTPFLPIKPLGTGWTHSFNAFVFKALGWSANNQTIHDKWFVFWPDGSFNCYDAVTLASETDGVFDEFFVVNATTVKVKKKNQVEFLFEKFTLPGGQSVYMLKTISDRNGNTITVTNEEANNAPRIDKVTGTNGHVLDFSYAPSTNYLSSVKDMSGDRTVFFSVSAAGNLVSFANAEGLAKTFDYGSNPELHLLHSITLPEGNVISSQYIGRKLSQVNYPGVPPLNVTVQPTYGQATALTGTITDQTGTNIVNKFNGNGYLAQRQVDGQTLNFNRNAQQDSSLISGATYGGLTVNYTYDANGNPLTIQFPGGITHTFTYNTKNDVLTYTNPRNFTTTYTYDGLGNLDQIADNLDNITDFTVESHGLVTSILNPAGILQSLQYSPIGYLKRVDLPGGIRSLMAYDTIGRMIKVTNPLDQVSEFDYNDLDQVTQTRRLVPGPGNNVVTSYSYNLNDKLTTINNALGNATTMGYNDREELISLAFGDDTKLFEYHEDGLLKKITKPNGDVLNYVYDALGRLTSDGYATYTYDANDNLTTVQKTGGLATTNTYDALNRLLTTSYDGSTVAYLYDNNSNITRITYPGGFQVNYSYDGNDRLTHVVWNADTVRYNYLDDGRINQMNYSNGIYCQYTYDAAGRTTGMYYVRSDGDTLGAYTAALDLLGNHLSNTRVDSTLMPSLPDANITGTYNAENEIQSYGSNNYTFNPNGNLANGAGQTYTWDIRNQLLTRNGDQFVYDGVGLRRQVTKNGTTTKYVWDPRGMGNILTEQDGSGANRYHYIHGLGLAARVDAQTNANNFYLFDLQANTTTLTDDNGAITHRYRYLPFGELLNAQEQNPNPFKFVGKYGVMHEGNDLYYMRARYYDAKTGRFLSEDPVWHDNLYPYAGNNPIVAIDPTGHDDEKYSFIFDILSKSIDGISNLSNLIGDEAFAKWASNTNNFLGGAMTTALVAKNIKNGNYGKATWESLKGLAAIAWGAKGGLGGAVVEIGFYGGNVGDESVFDKFREFDFLVESMDKNRRYIASLISMYKSEASNDKKLKIRLLIGHKMAERNSLQNQLDGFNFGK